MSDVNAKFARSAIRCLLVAASAFALSTGTTWAQQARAPVGPIEIVVGSGPGSTPDVLMRRMAQILNESKIVENPMAVVNRVGGSWAVATKHMLDRPGNENLVMCQSDGVFANPILNGTELTYNKLTSFGIFVQTQLLVVVQPNHKANTLPELIAMAKAAPQQIKIAGSSPGLVDNQVTGLLEKAGGVQLTFIPHSGGGAALATFLGGNTDGIILPIDEALPQVQAGKAKLLALLSEKRHTADALKNVPTAREQGIDLVWGQHFGVIGTANLDPAVQKWWEEKLAALVQRPEWKKANQDAMLGDTFIHGPAVKDYMETRHQTHLSLLRQLGVAKL